MTNTSNSTKNSNLTTFFDNLIERQKEWNSGSRKISKEELYSILAGCLDLVYNIKQNALYAKLEEELEQRNLTFNSGTSIATRVVRCVFNTHERSLSSFAAVIAIAQRQNVDSGDFVKWIKEHGGIDKTRREFTNKKPATFSIKELQDMAKNHLKSAPTLAVIAKGNIVNFKPHNSGFVINISRINPNGDCEVIATTTDSNAIRSALANWGQFVTTEKLTVGLDNSIRETVSNLGKALAS